jgi:hypothetical protein
MILAIAIGCTTEDQQMSESDVQALIARSLGPGDSEDEIVSFFETHDLEFDFDPNQRRYQSHWPSETEDSGVKSGIAIWIYVNEDGSFKEAVVEKVFTYL